MVEDQERCSRLGEASAAGSAEEDDEQRRGGLCCNSHVTQGPFCKKGMYRALFLNISYIPFSQKKTVIHFCLL